MFSHAPHKTFAAFAEIAGRAATADTDEIFVSADVKSAILWACCADVVSREDGAQIGAGIAKSGARGECEVIAHRIGEARGPCGVVGGRGAGAAVRDGPATLPTVVGDHIVVIVRAINLDGHHGACSADHDVILDLIAVRPEERSNLNADAGLVVDRVVIDFVAIRAGSSVRRAIIADGCGNAGQIPDEIVVNEVPATREVDPPPLIVGDVVAEDVVTSRVEPDRGIVIGIEGVSLDEPAIARPIEGVTEVVSHRVIADIM